MSCTLRITLVRGEGLPNSSKLFGEQSVRCVLELNQQVMKTFTEKKAGSNPVWNQVFLFDNVYWTDELKITIFSKNKVMSDTVLGACKARVNQVIPKNVSGEHTVFVPVFKPSGKNQGRLELRVQMVLRQFDRLVSARTALPPLTSEESSIYASSVKAPVSGAYQRPPHITVPENFMPRGIAACASSISADSHECTTIREESKQSFSHSQLHNQSRCMTPSSAEPSYQYTTQSSQQQAYPMSEQSTPRSQHDALMNAQQHTRQYQQSTPQYAPHPGVQNSQYLASNLQHQGRYISDPGAQARQRLSESSEPLFDRHSHAGTGAHHPYDQSNPFYDSHSIQSGSRASNSGTRMPDAQPQDTHVYSQYHHHHQQQQLQHDSMGPPRWQQQPSQQQSLTTIQQQPSQLQSPTSRQPSQFSKPPIGAPGYYRSRYKPFQPGPQVSPSYPAQPPPEDEVLQEQAEEEGEEQEHDGPDNGYTPQQSVQSYTSSVQPTSRAQQALSAQSSATPRPSAPAHMPQQPKWLMKQPYCDRDCRSDFKDWSVIGEGAYATTYSAMRKGTKQQFAVKVVNRNKLLLPHEWIGVQNEVKLLKKMEGNPGVVTLRDVWETLEEVSLCMELCTGGELFEAIVAKGRFTERDAAAVMRTVITTVSDLHAAGVVHRDLKPENLLYTDTSAEASLKVIDFGSACEFRPGMKLHEPVGSKLYVAPEVLQGSYGQEADLWSCGVIMYALLSGLLPFQGTSEKDILRCIQTTRPDLDSGVWESVSDSAKQCVKLLLTRDPSRRPTASDILQHEWLREHGCADDRPLASEVIIRLAQFSRMNRLKQQAMRVIATSLPIHEIAGLRQMFMDMDSDRSGAISLREFMIGLQNLGQRINMDDMHSIMEAADIDGNGEIDYEEFLAIMINRAKLQREDNLRKAFVVFDLNSDGRISRNELYTVLFEQGIDCSTIPRIIEEVDRNGDGMIDYKEFCLMMRKL